MQESYTPRVHTCFRLDIRFPINIGDRDQTESHDTLIGLWHDHSYQVIRFPDDLLAHTRRVRLCHEPSLNDRLMGALLDLEFVLDGKGKQLLGRLRSEALSILGTLDQPENPEMTKGRVLPTINQLMRCENLKESDFF